MQLYSFFILYFSVFLTFPEFSHICRLDEKALDLQLQSQRKRFDLGGYKSVTNGNESCLLWKPWLQCWGIMCKLQSKCWGWNLDQHSQAFAQSPTPTISITAYPNPTSFLDLIQYKFIFSSKVFKCLIGEEGLVLLKKKKKKERNSSFSSRTNVNERKQKSVQKVLLFKD